MRAKRRRLDLPASIDRSGQPFWEAADLPSHVLVNEGTVPVVVYATFFLTDGAAPIIDEPRPPVCAGIG